MSVKSPNVGKSDNDLEDVSIASAKNVWAVGYAGPKALVERWTPKGVKVVKTPSPAASLLEGVVGLSPANVWAVGTSTSKGVGHALIEHWTGKKWKIVAAAAPPNSRLHEIDGRSGKDLWAVGDQGKGDATHTFVEHWDGKSWKVVPSPNRGTTANYLTAVTVAGTNDVWAVGSIAGADNRSFDLVEHWNGKTWSLVSVPSPGGFQNFLESVDAVGPKDVWAVGNLAQQVAPPYFYKTMALHWNGSAWTVAPTPSPGTNGKYNSLAGVTVLKSGVVWAVGVYQAAAEVNYAPLALRRCG